MPRIDRPDKLLPYLDMLRDAGVSVSPADLDVLCNLLEDAEIENNKTGYIALNVSGGVVWGQMRRDVKFLSAGAPDASAPICEDGDVWERDDVFSRAGVVQPGYLKNNARTFWRDGVFGWVLGRTHNRVIRVCAEDGVLRGGWGSDGEFITFTGDRRKWPHKWGMIPDHYILGAAALWREGCVGANYWSLPKAVIRRQCEIRGWVRMANSGKIMTKPGVSRSCVDENSEEASIVFAKGLRQPRIWPVGAIEALAGVIGPDKTGEGCAAFYDAMSEWCAMEAAAGYMTVSEDMLRYVEAKKQKGWLS